MVNLREEDFTLQAICDVLECEKVKTCKGAKIPLKTSNFNQSLGGTCAISHGTKLE